MARAVPNDLDWHSSRYCNGGDCIMVASWDEQIVIKDSRDSWLAISETAWRRFMIDVKAGRLAHVG